MLARRSNVTLSRRTAAALALGALLLGLLAFGAGPAAAATPGEMTSFDVNACSGPGPGVLAAAAGEGVLVRVCPKSVGTSSTLVNLLPSGDLVSYTLPPSRPGAIVAGTAGEIWSVGMEEQSPAAGGAEASLDRIAPDGSVATFPLGSADKSLYRTLAVYGLVADGQGGVWVATGELEQSWIGSPFDSTGGELVHVGADGTTTRFHLPGIVEPQGLVRGPDGNLWFTGVSGKFFTEHSGSEGRGWIGRMTPAGVFSLYAVPAREPRLGGIAVGADGRLWFTEAAYLAPGLGTIGTDGSFGPTRALRGVLPYGPLTLGPEGNPWFATSSGVVRVTGAGQETFYRPSLESSLASVVTGPEGAIWSLNGGRVIRIVPGGPGIDLKSVAAQRQARTVDVTLACGGSPTLACDGTVELALKIPRSALPQGVKKAPIRFVQTPYSVAAESTATRTIAVPARIFKLARRYQPPHTREAFAPSVVAQVTVAGGPTFERRFRVPSLLGGR